MFLCRTASEQGGHIGLMTFTTGGQIEAITWNTSQGFSTALSAFIAQNYAAGRIERVLRAWHTTLWMTGIFGTNGYGSRRHLVGSVRHDCCQGADSFKLVCHNQKKVLEYPQCN